MYKMQFFLYIIKFEGVILFVKTRTISMLRYLPFAGRISYKSADMCGEHQSCNNLQQINFSHNSHGRIMAHTFSTADQSELRIEGLDQSGARKNANYWP